MKKYLFLILIIILAAFLRLYNISSYPAGLNADEAALGYNAYSLLLTGKDEHGHIIPVNLESFGDFKPALYSYLLVPVVKYLGLNEFAVRLPSALFGIFSVFLIYLLTEEIFKRPVLSHISALLLAISPWHLHFSRGAWEVNVSTAMILAGTVFYLKWLRNSSFLNFTFFILSFIFSLYTYQSARVIAPLLGLALVISFYKTFFNRIRQLLMAVPIVIIFIFPLLLSFLNSDAASRLSGVGILADVGPLNYVKELRGQYTSKTLILGKILHNRPVIYTVQFVKNYLSHFEGDFLFINGDVIQRNRIPETGLLYFSDFIFLILGFVWLVRNYKLFKFSRVVFIWLLIAPVAAALTFQVPHALRAQNMVIPLTVITACGIYFLLTPLLNQERGIKGVSSKIVGMFICLLLVTAYVWQFSRYLHEYYIHYPQTYPAAWEYGFKELVAYVQANQQKHSEILVTDKYDQPYILFLFYLKYPPQEFQGHHQLTVRDQYNFSTVKNFSKYFFTDTNWDKVRDMHGTLIVAAPEDIPPVGVNIVKTVYFPDGSPAFKLVSN
jgi:4-amino-4-deoxy-L-arabinose transferase-like glycosyltransferase